MLTRAPRSPEGEGLRAEEQDFDVFNFLVCVGQFKK